MPELVNIGLIGENPNDTESLIGLLSQRFSGEANFFSMLDSVNGSYLDDSNFSRAMRIALLVNDPKPQIIIAIRDLDGFANEKEKVRLRKEFFSKVRSTINLSSKSLRRASGVGKSENKFCFLLCIYEFEALILADIGVFNNLYKTNLICNDPEGIENPKEVLQKATKIFRPGSQHGTYQESHCRWLFPLLRIDTVEQNSRQFRIFLQELDQAINSLTIEN
jgi:hypothetical protein